MPDAEISMLDMLEMLDHCTGRQLKELLALASAHAKVKPNRLVEAGDSEQLRRLLAEMCCGAEPSGAALLEAVCSPDTTLEVLVATKRIAKRLAGSSETRPQSAAATLLYHLSVASALGYHNRNISSKDPAERLPLYEQLATELPDEELAAVFEKAIARLPSARP
jgi:hypothetical protein